MLTRFAVCLILAAMAPCVGWAQSAAEAEALEKAIKDLSATYGARYPGGGEFLRRLGRLGEEASSKASAAKFEALRREALLANPLVSVRPILFVTRRQYVNNHGTEATMCQTGEVNTHCFRGGGAVKVLDLTGKGSSRVRTLLELPKGVARDPEVSFDGRRILLSVRRNVRDDYHICEMDSDGGNFRQLTFAQRVSDIQPAQLPDGRVVFSSTREPKYIPCQRHLMCNLFVMDADGANIRQLGHNTQFEGRASVMPDGRILYTRWEYVDKHFAPAYGLWTVNPDGTNHALYYGGYAWQPSAIVDARIIPGSDLCVCVFSTAHELAWGAMVVVDPHRGLDGLDPVVGSWPADISQYMSGWDSLARIGNRYDSFRGIRVKYEDPYPLSKKYFLCSRSLSAKASGDMGIFLVDVFGNELLLHHESPGCFDPIPLGPRAKPPVLADRTVAAAAPASHGPGEGVFYIEDVYIGEMMDRVAPGTVKALRVVEAPPKLTYPPNGIGDWTPGMDPEGHHPVAVNWNHYNHKRILGTVPVEADGSVHFKAPAGLFVYFQLLDANGMMVHSMRSGTTLQPGETMGCVGCHEDKSTAPSYSGRVATALRRKPSRLSPWHGPARNFSYAAEVQPVLDRYCLRCHDHGGKGAGKMILCGDKGPAFNVSYSMLLSRSPAIWQVPDPNGPKPLVSSVGSGPVKVLPPMSWGSHRSRLVDMLRHGHNGVKLDDESFDRIVTWIDLNIPYYPTHAARYRKNTFGRSPLDHKQLLRLSQLVGSSPGGENFGWTRVSGYGGGRLSKLVMTVGSPINFTRPKLSWCLKAFESAESPAYREALGLIQAGRRKLTDNPRADMPKFRPAEEDQQRIDYHARRLKEESRIRRAAARGEKVYDDRP